MATTTKYTKAQRAKRIKLLLDQMTPCEGEMRTVNECGDCGELFGRRFIPYGIGRGITVGACTCQMTSHRPYKTIERHEP